MRTKVYIEVLTIYKVHICESFLVRSCPAEKMEVDASMTTSKDVNYYKKKKR